MRSSPLTFILLLYPANVVLSSLVAKKPSLSRQYVLSDNTSVLPPEWSERPQCYADCGSPDPLSQFMFGPAFVDPTAMTIELCVEFCDQQNSLMAGVIGDECRCSNIFNPDTCFESDFGECDADGEPCVGNSAESCGLANGSPGLLNIFFKGDLCGFLFQGGAALTSGPWRLSYFYNDTVGARALPHNAVDLHPSLKRGNLTIDACVNACGAAGFLLAGVEFADECYCGNELENNSQPIPECGSEPANAGAMPCKGNLDQFCGGPNLLYVYTLPGSGLRPLVPFDSIFDGFCSGCNEFGAHT